MILELRDRAVEVADVAVAAREHHAAFHRRQHEFRERARVRAGRHAVARRLQAILDRAGPVREILREPLAHGRVRLVDLEREAADRAAVGAIGLDQRVAIAVHQLPDLVDRIGDAAPGRFQQHLVDAADVGVEHRDQQVLLAGKEVIQAAAVDARAGQDVGDRSRAESLFPEQVHRRLQDAPAGVGWRLIDHSTKSATLRRRAQDRRFEEEGEEPAAVPRPHASESTADVAARLARALAAAMAPRAPSACTNSGCAANRR